MNIQVKRCACGCGRIVKSKRSNAKYATGACRVRAMRERDRRASKWEAMPNEWRDGFEGMARRYPNEGATAQQYMRNILEKFGRDAAIDAMNLFWAGVRYEGHRSVSRSTMQQGVK